MKRTILFTFFVLLAVTLTASAEETPCINLQVRVTKQPLYPPIAAAAHFSGKVEMDLHIDAQAKMLGVKNISGPLLLQGAASDYVKSWDLSWQEDGKHHACTEKVVITFQLLESTKSVSSYSYEIVTEDGTSATVVTVRPPYYKPTVLY
jgi:hypothetical protein